MKKKQKASAPATTSAVAEESISESPKVTQKKQKQKQKAKQAKKRTIEEVEAEATEEEEAAVEDAEASIAAEDATEGESDADACETAADMTMQDPAAEDSDLDDDDLAEAFRNAHQLDLQDDEDEEEEIDTKKLLPGWSHLPLHGDLKRALACKGFKQPTEIQNKSIPYALGLQQDAASSDDSDDAEASTSQARVTKKRDVVGVSQTGSGKTLAYGLPILNYLFENAENTVASSSSRKANDDDDVPPPLGALILCPTRELALQVSAHLTDVVKASCRVSEDEDDGISIKKLVRRPQIAVVCVVCPNRSSAVSWTADRGKAIERLASTSSSLPPVVFGR